MPDSELLSVLTLGLLLGAKHALDADHVAAISTLAGDAHSLRRSCRLGFCWGLGHTLVLLLAGLAVLIFKLTIPEAWSRLCEAGVGVMLVALGASVAWRLWREHVHIHIHAHGDCPAHLHLHSHRDGPHHRHAHRFRLEYRSLAIGMVHGLAGSAALVLLVLSAVPSVWQGVLYMVVFGLGSIGGMMLLGMALSLPFTCTAGSMARTHLMMRIAAGLASLIVGGGILYDAFYSVNAG